jgi:glutamate racemase
MPIGLFDSGVGGLSVLRALRAELPHATMLYVADSAHLPYGARPLAEVRGLSEAIARFLRERDADPIVIACHTASAAALRHLRQAQPGADYVGIEPAVKPAGEHTRTGVVGVLATPATFQGELYASVVERFAQGVRLIEQTCPGLVEQIEAGEVETPATETMLRGWVEPMLRRGIDVLVLGCTHYPFVVPLLRKICGPDVRIVDPAPAVARRAAELFGAASRHQAVRATAHPAPPITEGQITYATSGSTQAFAASIARLGLEPGPVHGLRWEDGELRVASDG